MRLPVTSESDAFRAVFVVAAVIAVCLALGYWIDPWVGVGCACLALIALPAWMLADRSRRSGLRAAESAGRIGAPTRGALLIVSEIPTREQFRAEILPHVGSREVLEIHAPVLQSRTHFVTTDIDRETGLARRRLEAALRLARSEGVLASGEVGDPIDPLAGVEDELRRFEAHDVMIATGTDPGGNWVESELLAQLGSALDKPITHVIVGHSSSAHAPA
jgi:hypothetical protein